MRLPASERTALLRCGEAVSLPMGEILQQPGMRVKHVHFPLRGFVSLLHRSEGHGEMEVAVVGKEGFVGAHLALGVAEAPFLAMVQGPGDALRIDAEVFCGRMADSPRLRTLMQRYLYVQMTQLATASSCTRHHDITARLARWLLMCRDRNEADEFAMTHEFLGYMLGVRRVGITHAAGALQRQGTLRYRRGRVHLLDPKGLQAAACPCYDADLRTHQRFMARAAR